MSSETGLHGQAFTWTWTSVAIDQEKVLKVILYLSVRLRARQPVCSVPFTLVQDSICVFGKAHNYSLHRISQKFSPTLPYLLQQQLADYSVVCLSVGRLGVRLHAPNLTEIVRLNPGLEPGGHYHPAHCRARHRVAVVVPYRDRQQHLRILLHNLHPMLMRQQLDYFILVVELVRSFGVFS